MRARETTYCVVRRDVFDVAMRAIRVVGFVRKFYKGKHGAVQPSQVLDEHSGIVCLGHSTVPAMVFEPSYGRMVYSLSCMALVV